MRNHLTILLLGLILSHFVFGQHIYFSNRYDFKGQCSSGSNAIAIISNGYLVAAEVDSDCAYGKIGLMQLDSTGNKKWQKVYGGGTHSYTCSDVINVTSGNYVFTGSKDSGIIILKFNNVGDSIWSRTFFDPLNYLGVSRCILTKDKAILLVGIAQGKKNSLYQVLVIKIDSVGNTKWRKIFSSSGNDFGYSIDTTSDGGYIVGAGWNSPQLIKLDSSGNVKWIYSYPASGFAGVTSLKEGGYAFSTNKDSSNYSEMDIIKVDSNGKLLWNFGYSPYASTSMTGPNCGVVEMNDYTLITAGQIKDNNATDGSVMRVDSSGKLIWYRNYRKVVGATSANYLRDCKTTLDGGIVASGFCSPTSSQDTGLEDVWVLKIDSNGCDSIGLCSTSPNLNASVQELNTHSNIIHVYPNPNNGIFTVITQEDMCAARIEIYNMLGQIIYKRTLKKVNTEIRLDGQSIGVYLYRVISEKGEYIASGKLIVQ